MPSVTSSLVHTLSVVHMLGLVVIWGLHFSLVPLNSSCGHLSTQLDSHKGLVNEFLCFLHTCRCIGRSRLLCYVMCTMASVGKTLPLFSLLM